MTANEIRQKFLGFFKSKGHTIVESASLVPPEAEDKTVLFTTAGMQQFKRQFLGHIEGYTRAASCQKCLRTDDLDKVGKTAYHHTFFEMLGNFSFGDYFKKEAIAYAWEFLTKELKLPADKLWVSVYEEDTEAYDIWLKGIKVPANRIIKLGDKSNFWPSEAKKNGPNGPCGPCSEIFYDYGVNADCPKKDKCNPDCSCGRFSEIWNLVFTQFNRKEGGILEPLPAKNIDTGMGLERLVAIVQGKKNNYETDLFMPIIKTIGQEAKNEKIKLNDYERFVIADHIRGIVFGIVDGVIPSNEGRGYIMRRLIIESTDIIIQKGINKALVYKLVPSVIDVMKAPYPEIVSKSSDIAGIIKRAEEAYVKVQKERLPELKNEVKKILEDKTSLTPKRILLGETFFKFRGTYGLTLTAILEAVKSTGISESDFKEGLDEYEQQMFEQQERSRTSSKMTGEVFSNSDLEVGNTPKTKFLGYEQFESKVKILKIFYKNKGTPQEKVGIILDQTPFYAESGGQIGDSGWLISEKGKVRVEDTKKEEDRFIHFGKLDGTIKVGDSVDAKIDSERRLAIMRNHTATHLLQSALREVLGTHIQQQGSLVAEDRLRFDFTHPKALTKEQIAHIEDKINNHISAHDPVVKEEMSLDEAKKKGALAFFAEKYKDRVRVISMGNYSKEFCGGTHLNSTDEIGPFKIKSEGAVAQGIRRLEAITGPTVADFIRSQEQQKQSQEKKDIQTQKDKQLKKELENSRFEAIRNSLDALINASQQVNGTKIIAHDYKDIDPDALRKVMDLIKIKTKSAVITLASEYEGRAFILTAVTEDLVKKGIKANDLIQNLAAIINGSGGGRENLAQAGSKEAKRVKEAIKEAPRLIKEKIMP